MIDREMSSFREIGSLEMLVLGMERGFPGGKASEMERGKEKDW